MRLSVPGARWLPAFVLGVAVSGGAAFALSAGQDAIHACVAPTGHLRIDDGNGCVPGESSLTWNKRGRPGARGPRGYLGPQGPPGPSGGSGGGSASGPSLEAHTSEDPMTSSSQGVMEVVPGSEFTLDVPDDALVAFGGRAATRFGKGDCDGALGEIELVDTDTGLNVATLSFDLIFPPFPGPATVALKKRFAALRATTPGIDGSTTDDTETFDLIRRGWLGNYQETEPGTQHLVIEQFVYGMRNDGGDCLPEYVSSHRKVWTSVFRVGNGG
jgi:hypothetical protein